MRQIDKDKIAKLTNNYKDEIADFCKEVIKIPSVNGLNTEDKIAKLINKRARDLGLDSRLIFLDKKRPNVFVGSGFKKKAGLLFIAHLDTVPVGNENLWKYPPFAGQMKGGKIFGRGAIDNKAGAALSIYTLKVLKELGMQKIAKFVGVVDEEGAPDSTLGAYYLLKKGLNAETAIYTYPGVRTVTIGHRGIVRIWIEIEGEAAHTGSREWQDGKKGASAIEAAVKFIDKLSKVKMEGSHDAFPGYSFKNTVTLIEGGSGESIVPDEAKVLIDARLLPNHNPERYIHKIRSLTNTLSTNKIKFKIKVKNNIPGAVISSDEKIVGILKKLDREVMEITPVVKGAGPVCEGYMFINKGIPTICGFGAVGGNYHSADEYVEVESLPKVLEMYVKAAIELSS